MTCVQEFKASISIHSNGMMECMTFMAQDVPAYKMQVVHNPVAQMYNPDTSQKGVQWLLS